MTRSALVNVLNFSRFISTATTEVIVLIVNQKPCRKPCRKSYDPYTREQGGFLGVGSPQFHKRTVNPKLQNDPLNF